MITRKNALIFIVLIGIILTITGLIYGFNNSIDISDYLSSLENNNNLIINHIIVLILFLISTLSILGIALQTIYIGIESIGIGYIIANFISVFKTKGLVYSIINILVNKGLYIIILIYLFTVSISYIKQIILNIIGVKKDYLNNIMLPLLKKYSLIILILFIYDILIYFFGNMFLNYLTFML